ncbi:helix-turn-helix transcriptional regulator, partial [Candidatus Bathyarchaeota archaeon]|nr:helix-turn-helix transcriptional regulator [Candidatus Bathyarchaeota archaeon]
MNAASRGMAQKGFEGSRLNEIAQEAGATEPTIYLHFKGKESLLLSVAEEHMARYLLFLNEHQQGISGAHNKLRKLVWAHLRYSDIKREFMSLVLFDCRNKRGFYQSGAYNLVRKYSGILSSILEEGIGEKVFRSDMNIPLVRDIIFGLLDYEATESFVTKETSNAVLDLEGIMQLLDQMLLRKYRTENQPADKRQRILQAAVKAFSEKGYDRATIAEIAHKAGVADGTIYEYFDNKEDVLISIAEERFSEYLEQLKQTFTGNTPPKKLWLFMVNHFQQYLNDPNFAIIFLSTIQFNRRFYESRAYKSQHNYEVELERLIQEVINEGNLESINIRVFRNMFLGAFSHMALRWFLVHPERVFDKMAEMKEVAMLLS